MVNIYPSTRVNRPPGVRDEATAGPRSNRFQASIIKKWLRVVLCLVFLFSASCSKVAVPQAVHADEEVYLFDKVITWADGSTEHVQIGRDFFFWLGGVKKHLVAMTFDIGNPSNPGHESDFSNAANMALFEKQLAYLQSKDVRLIRVFTFNATWLGIKGDPSPERAAYDALFALFSKYKMLVIPLIRNNYITGFDAAMNAHTMASLPTGSGDETFNTWMLRLLPILANYTNIVAVCCENELDCTSRYLPTGMTYDASDVAYHMTYLTGLVKSLTPFLTTHNLMMNDLEEPEIKAAVLHLIDIPSFDVYQKTPAKIESVCETYLPQLGVGNWWGMEIGHCNRGDPDWKFDQNLVTAEFLDAAFKAKATVAFMLTNISRDDTMTYFDLSGNPKANLTGIAREIPRLQAAVPLPVFNP